MTVADAKETIRQVIGTGPFDQTWASLKGYTTPAWYQDAKFGIFIHWGVYSVPAWAPKGKYAEWYWHDLVEKELPTREFHLRTYGLAFGYPDFAPHFRPKLFKPAQ